MASPLNRSFSQRMAVRLHLWSSLRNWTIFTSLIYLHLRYVRFHPAMLNTLPDGLHRGVLNLNPDELGHALRWNHKIAEIFHWAGASYTRCMKRALVMAMMLADEQDLWLVIGVDPGQPSSGHAWLECRGRIIVEAFDHTTTPYQEIRRLKVVHKDPS